MHLTLNGKEIRLIGTAHVSKESIDEVIHAIREERPGVVCVELDEGRLASIKKPDNWERLNISKVLKEGKGFLLIANIALSGFQRRMGNELGVKPGAEMIAAVETAEELGIPYKLCDREVQTTFRRAWGSCGLWNKCKLIATLLAGTLVKEKLSAEEVENLKQSSELDGMMTELAEYLPSVKETLIDERDRYLAAKIWEASKNSGEGAKGVLAIVGAGHMRGIQACLEKFAADESGGSLADGNSAVTDTSDLETIPPKSFLSKSAKWIIPAIVLSFIVAGFIRADFSDFVTAMGRWVLWNGSLAALGSIIALGHPLAILVSFLGAPFTTLNPFIGVGIISGLVQATMRKPRVSDAENFSADVASLKGIYRNRISKVLLVFFLSSLGSSIATLPAVLSVANLLR